MIPRPSGLFPTTYSPLVIEPVEPTGSARIVRFCLCRNPHCPGRLEKIISIPPTAAILESTDFLEHRVNLGLPARDAAARLGVSLEQLEALERGFARCDWARARELLRCRGRAVA